MKKNRTEYFPSNIINFIPSNQVQLSKKEKKHEMEYKIEQEMKSNSAEFYNILKQNLQKNEITKERFLSKNVAKDKKLHPDLLISKLINYEKYIKNRKIIMEKLSKENENFLKRYNFLKKSETKNGKESNQQEYLKDIAKIYLEKNYDLIKSGIMDNENIFKYSILNDIEFGKNITNDVLRILKEMDNNEFIKEQKLIFDFQDALLKEKINNKVNHPAEVLIENKVKEENDYGIDDICFIKRKKKKKNVEDKKEEKKEDKKEENKEDKKEEKKEDKKEENKEEKDKEKEEQKEENNEIIIEVNKNKRKPRPSFLYLQIKKDIKKMQKNIINLDKVKKEYRNEKLIKFRELFKPRFSIINKSFSAEVEGKENLNKKDDNNNKKDNPITLYNNTEIKQNLNKIKPINLSNDNRKNNKKITIIEKNLLQKRFSVLPNVNNKSFGALYKKEKNKNLNRTNTNANYSFNDSNSNSQLNLHFKRKHKNYQTQLYKNYLISEGKNKSNDTNLFNLKQDLNIPRYSLINNRILKMPLKENELITNIEKFKNKRGTIYNNILDNSHDFNVYKFANYFRNITEKKSFGNVQIKNRYLIQNNFEHLISNLDLLSDEEQEGKSLHKLDKKIDGIIYDWADHLLGSNILNKSQMVG